MSLGNALTYQAPSFKVLSCKATDGTSISTGSESCNEQRGLCNYIQGAGDRDVVQLHPAPSCTSDHTFPDVLVPGSPRPANKRRGMRGWYSTVRVRTLVASSPGFDEGPAPPWLVRGCWTRRVGPMMRELKKGLETPPR